jgi:hypothetical protein
MRNTNTDTRKTDRNRYAENPPFTTDVASARLLDAQVANLDVAIGRLMATIDAARRGSP